MILHITFICIIYIYINSIRIIIPMYYQISDKLKKKITENTLRSYFYIDIRII